jgi:hypothetical protein
MTKIPSIVFFVNDSAHSIATNGIDFMSTIGEDGFYDEVKFSEKLDELYAKFRDMRKTFPDKVKQITVNENMPEEEFDKIMQGAMLFEPYNNVCEHLLEDKTKNKWKDDKVPFSISSKITKIFKFCRDTDRNKILEIFCENVKSVENEKDDKDEDYKKMEKNVHTCENIFNLITNLAVGIMDGIRGKDVTKKFYEFTISDVDIRDIKSNKYV